MKDMVRVKDRQSCIMNPRRANRTIPRAKEAWNKKTESFGPNVYKARNITCMVVPTRALLDPPTSSLPRTNIDKMFPAQKNPVANFAPT